MRCNQGVSRGRPQQKPSTCRPQFTISQFSLSSNYQSSFPCFCSSPLEEHLRAKKGSYRLQSIVYCMSLSTPFLDRLLLHFTFRCDFNARFEGHISKEKHPPNSSVYFDKSPQSLYYVHGAFEWYVSLVSDLPNWPFRSQPRIYHSPTLNPPKVNSSFFSSLRFRKDVIAIRCSHKPESSLRIMISNPRTRPPVTPSLRHLLPRDTTNQTEGHTGSMNLRLKIHLFRASQLVSPS